MNKVYLLFLSVLLLGANLMRCAQENSDQEPIYVNSIRKSGTHLLVTVLEKLLAIKAVNLSVRFSKDGDFDDFHHGALPLSLADQDRPNKKEFFFFHIPHSIEAQELLDKHYKHIFIYRDPRDRLVSEAFWILSKPWFYQICFPLNEKDSCKVSFDYVLDLQIKNTPELYGCYMPWLYGPNCCGVRFEALVGPQGGGTIERQRDELKKLCRFLNVRCATETFDKICSDIFGRTATFRSGQIGEWRKYFTPERKKMFKELSGQLLIELGYENDLDW